MRTTRAGMISWLKINRMYSQLVEVIAMILNRNRSHLFVIRIYHPGSREKYKIDSLRESRRATSYHPSLVQFCDSGTTASPWGEVDYAVFEPLIPLTWLVDYEAGRRRVFPPGFIWVLAKNTIEGLACLHSCGITMLGR